MCVCMNKCLFVLYICLVMSVSMYMQWSNYKIITRGLLMVSVSEPGKFF